MSKVLMIRHLPKTLSTKEKEQLLQHFGADKVWETTNRRNYVFASFATAEKAKASLTRLHQLEIARRRIVVEYASVDEPVTRKHQQEQSSAVTKHVQEFLRMLNGWNPSVDFYQPPPVHVKYQYPDISTNIAMNIIRTLFSNRSFYIQCLHLMNKMCIKPPFEENESAKQFFKETFRELFGYSNEGVPSTIPLAESEESEISSEENEQKIKAVPQFKRKRKLAAPIKTPAAVLSTATLPKVKKIAPISQEDVFETAPIQEPKKISLVVHHDALQKPTEEPEVIGELGKFHVEPQPDQVEETHAEKEKPTVSKKELLRNRISYRDMKVLPVFKKYQPGQPSMRLYIKNLAKSVTEQDLKSVYRRYVEGIEDDELIGFDVRLMQEGRMKGQAFVTFPSVSIAEKALHETNGYLLKEKPMVVQFGRVANKKSIE